MDGGIDQWMSPESLDNSQSISGYPVSSYCYSASSATSVCVLFVHNKPNIRNITDVFTLI